MDTQNFGQSALSARHAVVFYHANCMDGMGAAWAFRHTRGKEYKECFYYPVKYGETPPVHVRDSMVEGTDLFIVDFSYPKAELHCLCDMFDNVWVLDHHKTAQADLTADWYVKPENLRITFDMNRSGAGLVWDTFAPKDWPRSQLISYIEDRDLWKFQMYQSKEINAYIAAHDLELAEYDKIHQKISANQYHCSEIGTYLLRAHQKHVHSIVKSCTREISINGIKGLVCNCSPMFASDVGNELVKLSGTYGATYYHGSDDSVYFSLRSEDGKVDVSELAKKFGGGGHRNASGFVMKKPLDQSDSGITLWNLEN